MIMAKRPRGDGASPARFTPGELVRHVRYSYRGVVVALDLECKAPDDWYRSNQTQPDRTQPWYHVLVDGTHHTTYAAQENLTHDFSMDPIAHPLVQLYFRAFEEGAYVRNDRAWGEH